MSVLTQDQMKEKAVSYLRKLGICHPYVRSFARKKNPVITMFIAGGGYYIDEHTEDQLLAKIREIEKEYGGLVYAVIKYKMNGDTLYALLWVSQHKDDYVYADLLRETSHRNSFNAFAYVYNASCEDFSEFGEVPVFSIFGGITIGYGRY